MFSQYLPFLGKVTKVFQSIISLIELFNVNKTKLYDSIINKYNEIKRNEKCKTLGEIKSMTGYEYFSYLLELKNNSEEYILNLSINENLKVYDCN